MQSTTQSSTRIAFLWSRPSGYLNACLRELARRNGVELLFYYCSPSHDAPFAAESFQWIEHAQSWTERPDAHRLAADLEAFKPDVTVFSGWLYPEYRRTARRLAGQSLRIMAIDNCWQGTVRQRLAAIFASRSVRSLTDLIWLPGERQAAFARQFGFKEGAILRGVYACDKPLFSQVYKSRIAERRKITRAFIFVGRFAQEKGIRTLLRAYRNYRDSTPHPWPLYCCGAGPLEQLIKSADGVVSFGFCQPEKLAAHFAQSACLVLPSTFEPWAVVVHEAASAGLAILASQRVGAAVHLVQPGMNGHIFEANDEYDLTSRLIQISELSDERLESLSSASVALADQFSPERWADTLLEAHSRWIQPPAERAAFVA